MTQASEGRGERLTIIRPSFMKITQGKDAKPDGCRAALFNHILYWIGQKARGIQREEIQAGHVYYYAKTEELTDQMSHAWEVCKVRKEVNALIEMGLLGKITNPHYGVDRTKHFIFGAEQCRHFLAICQVQKICIHQIGLPPDIVHLIYSSNAYMNPYVCSCGQMIDISEQMIDISEQMIDISGANDRYIRAITKVTTKVTTKDTDKEEQKEQATHVAAPVSDLSSESENESHAQHSSRPPLTVDQAKKKKRQAKQEPLEMGPPVLPSQDARWCAETAVQLVEAKKAQRYSPTTRSQELREATKILEMRYKGQALSREQFERAWDKMVKWPFWKEKDIKPMIRHLRNDDKILTLLEEMKGTESRSEPALGNGITHLGADGFKILSQMEVMKMKPDLRREYSKCLNAHLEAHPEDRKYLAPK